MATHGENRINGKAAGHRSTNGSQRQNGGFPGSDGRHRTLTGRQSPEPVSARLRMIYGNIVAEELPDGMLDLLFQLDQKGP